MRQILETWYFHLSIHTVVPGVMSDGQKGRKKRANNVKLRAKSIKLMSLLATSLYSISVYVLDDDMRTDVSEWWYVEQYLKNVLCVNDNWDSDNDNDSNNDNDNNLYLLIWIYCIYLAMSIIMLYFSIMLLLIYLLYYHILVSIYSRTLEPISISIPKEFVRKQKGGDK